MELDEFFEPVKKRVSVDLWFDDFGSSQFITDLVIESYGKKTSLCFDNGERVPLEDLGDLIIGA